MTRSRDISVVNLTLELLLGGIQKGWGYEPEKE